MDEPTMIATSFFYVQSVTVSHFLLYALSDMFTDFWVSNA